MEKSLIQMHTFDREKVEVKSVSLNDLIWTEHLMISMDRKSWEKAFVSQDLAIILERIIIVVVAVGAVEAVTIAAVVAVAPEAAVEAVVEAEGVVNAHIELLLHLVLIIYLLVATGLN